MARPVIVRVGGVIGDLYWWMYNTPAAQYELWHYKSGGSPAIAWTHSQGYAASALAWVPRVNKLLIWLQDQGATNEWAVYQLATTGGMPTLLVNLYGVGFGQPNGVADFGGYVYVTQSGAGILRFDPTLASPTMTQVHGGGFLGLGTRAGKIYGAASSAATLYSSSTGDFGDWIGEIDLWPYSFIWQTMISNGGYIYFTAYLPGFPYGQLTFFRVGAGGAENLGSLQWYPPGRDVLAWTATRPPNGDVWASQGGYDYDPDQDQGVWRGQGGVFTLSHPYGWDNPINKYSWAQRGGATYYAGQLYQIVQPYLLSDPVFWLIRWTGTYTYEIVQTWDGSAYWTVGTYGCLMMAGVSTLPQEV